MRQCVLMALRGELRRGMRLWRSGDERCAVLCQGPVAVLWAAPALPVTGRVARSTELGENQREE